MVVIVVFTGCSSSIFVIESSLQFFLFRNLVVASSDERDREIATDCASRMDVGYIGKIVKTNDVLLNENHTVLRGIVYQR